MVYMCVYTYLENHLQYYSTTVLHNYKRKITQKL